MNAQFKNNRFSVASHAHRNAVVRAAEQVLSARKGHSRRQSRSTSSSLSFNIGKPIRNRAFGVAMIRVFLSVSGDTLLNVYETASILN